jgi:hypothetical protein
VTSVVPPLAVFLTGATAITAAAVAFRWWMEPARRTRRTLAARLGGALDAVVMASDRGEGIALRVTPPGIAVLRGPGDRGLAFGFEELLGVELMVNGEVRARVFRGEARRPLDVTRVRLEHLALRLVFDDLRYPDFELRLRDVGEAEPEPSERSALALDSARRMFAHLEAVLRQGSGATVAARPPPASEPPPLEPRPDDADAEDPPF